MPSPHISLLELLSRIASTINAAPAITNQWVTGEVIDMRNSGGHLYLDLIEKDEAGRTVAKVRANIWRSTLASIYTRRGQALRDVLANGHEVRVLCSATFHRQYGLSLNISDVDTQYTRDTTRRQAIILEALKKEEIIYKNKERFLSRPAQRIAVISSAGAAGYGDFMNQLTHNRSGIVFYPVLFEAAMQGVNVSSTVRAAIDQIESVADMFDCIAILRGGGATTDLDGFDDLELARAVALCGLPVIVGIGHERDNTVLDFIAHTRVKTPTAAAEFLVSEAEAFYSRLHELSSWIANTVSTRLSGDHRQLESIEQLVPVLARGRADAARSRLDHISEALPLLVTTRVQQASAMLDRASRAVESAGTRAVATAGVRLQNYLPALRQALRVRISRENQLLASLSDKVSLLSPQCVLARGYSITIGPDGRALRAPEDAPVGTTLITHLEKGSVTSIVNS